MRINASSLLLSLLVVGQASAESGQSIQQRLQDALLCKADPIGMVYEVVEAGSNFAGGYAVHSLSSELDWKGIIVVDQPILIHGARAQALVGGPSASEEDFAGLVYARFKGDHQQVVKALALQPTAADAIRIGAFQKAMPNDAEGETTETCPMTIGLTPLEDGEFLLGCGWCNG